MSSPLQAATLDNVRIKSVHDANVVFHAVFQGKLNMITRRLAADERTMLRPGHIFVWEERTAHSESSGMGIERWTDGRAWGPSRVRDDFLYYSERLRDDTRNRAAQAISLDTTGDAWVKQTYSVHLSELNDGQNPRKWHLTAYYTANTSHHMRSVEDVPELHDVDPPAGMYIKARQPKSQRRDERHRSSPHDGYGRGNSSSGPDEHPDCAEGVLYAPFRSSSLHRRQHHRTSPPPLSPMRSSRHDHARSMPYPARHVSPESSSASSPGASPVISPRTRTALPSLARPAHPSFPYAPHNMDDMQPWQGPADATAFQPAPQFVSFAAPTASTVMAQSPPWRNRLALAPVHEALDQRLAHQEKFPRRKEDEDMLRRFSRMLVASS